MMTLRVRRVCGVISTDDILPARFKHSSTDPAELGQHVFEYRLSAEARCFRVGDCVVGDAIFGIGSSREQAVSAMLAAGVRAVFAPAFGRIFFRNAWNLALPAIEIDLSGVEDGAELRLNLEHSTIETGGRLIKFPPASAEMLAMQRAGGLLPLLASELGRKEAASEVRGEAS